MVCRTGLVLFCKKKRLEEIVQMALALLALKWDMFTKLALIVQYLSCVAWGFFVCWELFFLKASEKMTLVEST